ncbi:hypothetical protein BH20VER3_BH20VER3_02570 [soil metagenome]
MTYQGISRRVGPLAGKLSGRFPLCPWRTAFWPLRPAVLSAYPPPQKIEIEAEETEFRLLRFDGRHSLWFPRDTPITPEMWSEYLSVFWQHPANAHRYLAHGNFLKPGDVCIDCGACEGTFALQALEAGAAQVICLEASAEMARCLERTFAGAIHEEKIVVRNLAVGAIDAVASFAFDPAHPFGGGVGDGGTRSSVKVETLATICADLDRLDFVKMDIEGAEIQAIEGALPMLRKLQPRLAITTYHRAFDYAALRAMLVAAGYRSINPVGCTERGKGVPRPVMLHAWVDR